MLPVFPGTVHNTSSLFTYDSWLLVHNFLYRPKHDPTFKPVFPDEIVLSPSQAEEAVKLCGDDHFCKFDVAATGSLSVGNATRVAHQLHHHRLQSLQPGEGRGRGAWVRGWAPCTGTGSSRLASGMQWPAAQACHLCYVPIPVVSCGWLASPSNGHKEDFKYLMGSTIHFHCDDGYSLAGAETSTCQADGTWSAPTPQCQLGEDAPSPCTRLPLCADMPKRPSAPLPPRQDGAIQYC